MSTLSRQQLQQYAANAGFTGASQNIITAIALAESGGNSDAYNPNDPFGGSYGVLQINGAHIVGGETTHACTLDPQCSFNFAFKLSNGGQNFNPWSTYTGGAYQQYMSSGAMASSASNAAGATTPLGFDPLAGITSLFTGLFGQSSNKQSLFSYFTKPLRVVKVVIGGTLIIMSLGMAVFGLASSQPVQDIAGAASNIPGAGGTAAKAVRLVGQTSRKKGIVGKAVHLKKVHQKTQQRKMTEVDKLAKDLTKKDITLPDAK